MVICVCDRCLNIFKNTDDYNKHNNCIDINSFVKTVYKKKIKIGKLATQRIDNTVSKAKQYKNFKTINVLKWKNSEWKTLSPYYLKTDGNERNENNGGIIFENFYQGCKVYDIVYENKVYASRFVINNPKYLWWHFKPESDSGDKLINNNIIDYRLYYRWRNSLWNASESIRYPNKIHRRKNTKFSLLQDKRLNYIQSRKQIYVKEYVRLIRKLPEYQELLINLKSNINLLICEVDVPALNKNGNYKNCDKDGNCEHSLLSICKLINDPNEAFGHGLALIYALLLDTIE